MTAHRRAGASAGPLVAIALAIAAVGCAWRSLGAEATPPSPAIRWVPLGGGRVRVEVVGAAPTALGALSESGSLRADEASRFFAVAVAEGERVGRGPRPPMLGRYRLERGRIVFEPRFPLEPGLRYRASFEPGRLPGSGTRTGAAGSSRPIAAEFSLPAPGGAASTAITRVYPTGDVLPENLLRFYVHFSAPMSRGAVYGNVRLLDASGKAVDLPFLELAEELWNPEGTRLTLLFDPGRIKRGLRPREEAGPILEAGKTYTLAIARDWPDARGNPLAGEFRKTFRAAAPDDASPDPRSWTLRRPARPRGPLVLEFPEPLDHAMLGRVIGVADEQGRPVAGAIAIDRGETRWRFTPDRPWSPGNYRVLVDRSLEDLAGNSVARPFEVDVFDKVAHRETAETVALPFEVEP